MASILSFNNLPLPAARIDAVKKEGDQLKQFDKVNPTPLDAPALDYHNFEERLSKNSPALEFMDDVRIRLPVSEVLGTAASSPPAILGSRASERAQEKYSTKDDECLALASTKEFEQSAKRRRMVMDTFLNPIARHNVKSYHEEEFFDIDLEAQNTCCSSSSPSNKNQKSPKYWDGMHGLWTKCWRKH